MAQLSLKALKELIHDKEFWKNAIANSHINKELVVEIDYGVCKEVVDKGRNLRL